MTLAFHTIGGRFLGEPSKSIPSQTTSHPLQHADVISIHSSQFVICSPKTEPILVLYTEAKVFATRSDWSVILITFPRPSLTLVWLDRLVRTVLHKSDHPRNVTRPAISVRAQNTTTSL